MNQPFNILIAGVGGQGSLVAANILAHAAFVSGHSVTIGQIFGASRRGGSVFTHVRIWEKELGPLIPRGHVDIILGLEALETLRASYELGSKITRVIMNTTKVPTLDTLAGRLDYPSINAMKKILGELCNSIIVVNPAKALKRLNAMQDLNVYMLGILSTIQDIPIMTSSIEQGIRETLEKPDRSLRVFNEAVAKYSK